MDLPTTEELFRIARDEALVRNPALDRLEIERRGSDSNIMLAGAVAMADAVIGQLAKVEAARFQATARGRDLERLLFDRYGMVKKQASPAIGEVQFTTTAPTGGAFTIPDGTLLTTAYGTQFIVVGSATFPAVSTGPVTAIVRSVQAGADQQAAAGTITSISSAITGMPNDLRVTNSAATAGADDEESDDSFRARAKDFFQTARRGTLSALRTGALTVPGCQKAAVFETLNAEGYPGRFVQIVVSDAYTEQFVGSTVPATYAAQAATFALTVANALEDWRAAGVGVVVTVAEVILQSITLSLRYTAGADTNTTELRARAAVVGVVNDLAPGAALDPAALITALRSVSGLYVTGNEVLAPAGVVVPRSLEVIRTSLSLVVA